jgi:hypothetical protein
MSKSYAYINPETGEVRFTQKLSRSVHDNIVDGDMNGDSIVRNISDEPSVDHVNEKYWDFELESWQDKPPRPEGGYYNWTLQGWEFDSQRFMSDLRTKRNALLASSDWTRMDDNGMSDGTRTEWAEYRQALRDITENLDGVESLESVVWPPKP